MPRRVRYRFDIFKLLLILIPCFYFLPELTGQSYFAGWDITRLNLPLKWFDVQSIRHGALPLWNPYLYAGMPQLAESESGLFYPGNLLLHLPGDFFYLANLTYILHFILAGLFMDLWLRGRGIEPKISFFGGIIYQTAPFLVFHITSMALFQSIVWFPLLLWLADRYFDAPDSRARRLISGWLFILGGMLVFVGSAQMAFYQGFLLFWYLIGTIAADRSKEALRPLKALGIIASLILGAVLIGAIIWLPAMEFAKTTVREASGKAFYFLGSNWLTPVRLASMFYFPAYAKQTDVVGWASSLIYVGLLPTFAAFLRLAGIRVNWKKDAPLIVMGAVALILAFGMRNPLNHILIKFPPFEMFRYQGRFALGVIAALIPLACSWMSERFKRDSVKVDEDEHELKLTHLRLKWVIGIAFVLFAAFILTTHRSTAVLIGGIILIIDILLSWYGISILMRHPIRYPTLQRGSVQCKNRPTINGGVPNGPVPDPRYPTLQRGSVQCKNRPTINGGVPNGPVPDPRYPTLQRGSVQCKNRPTINGGVPNGPVPDPRYPTLQRGSVQCKNRPTINRPTINGGVPRTIPVWMALYLIFHLVIVFPVGRLATMKANNFNLSYEFFDQIQRDDGLPPRLLAVGIGRFADQDLMEFNKWTPQDTLPNICSGNTGIFRNVQVMDPYTPLRPVEWDSIIRDDISKEFDTVIANFKTSGSQGKISDNAAQMLTRLGVDAVVTSNGVSEIPGYEKVDLDLTNYFNENARLFKVVQQQPRIWLAPDGVIEPEKTSHILSNTVPVFAGNMLKVETNIQNPGTLIVETSYDPNWTVISISPHSLGPVEKTGIGFCGIKIPEKGFYKFSLVYNPQSVVRGIKITVSSLIITILWIFLNLPWNWRKSPLPRHPV